MSARLLVVVASDTGRTRKLADALAEGAAQRGALVEVVPCAEVEEAQLLAADALVLGSGVHMGGMESSMRAFFERFAPLWMQGRLIGKLGAAFVTAGNGGRGGGELTLISLHAFMAEHGLLLVPMHNRLDRYLAAGSHWGPLAWTNPRGQTVGPTEDHLAAARAHGGWIVECADRWARGAAGDPSPEASGS